MIPSLGSKPHEDRVLHLILFSLEKYCLQGKLIEGFKEFNDFSNTDLTKLFMMDDMIDANEK